MKFKFLTVLATMAIAFGISACSDKSSKDSDESVSSTKVAKGVMKDDRDGKTYKTVKIGNQTWMAENLNYKTSDSKCYDNKESNCDKYGLLYVWNEKMVANVCPDGWHLPSKGEFETLLRNVGGANKAGMTLKSRGGWNDYEGKNGNGRDEYGFGSLPAGIYDSVDDDFGSEGYRALFWSSTEYNSKFAYFLDLFYSRERAGVDYFNKGYGFSVRCVKNN